MADSFYFLPDDSSPEAANGNTEELATPQQWASMTFAPVVLNTKRFGPAWDQTRGEVARTAIAVLSYDDRALTDYFLAQPEPLRRAMEVHASLQQEIEYLRTHIEALEMASTRLLCVASRCAEDSQ